MVSKYIGATNDGIGVEDNENGLKENESQAKLPAISESQKILNVAAMGFGSLGSIYGDIGTSPLYVLNTVFPGTVVDKKQAIGAVSCIFWVFTLIVILKYCLLVLTLGPNEGEGGQIAIYCKISRFLKTGPIGAKLPGEKEVDDLQLLTRSETRESSLTNSSFLKKSSPLLYNKKFRKLFSFISMCLCFFGCTLVMADGLLTPTTSVLSAVDGIAVAIPSFDSRVMPVAVCILLALFFIQPFGSQYISLAFSPIITIWFLTILVIGIINITPHPEVFQALSPKEAIDFLKSQGDIDVLGSVMLSITGCEAMFADVGHFSPLSVQLTLGLFVYPCLMITYLGQASYLIDHPDKVSNLFFNCIPGGISGGAYWFVFVLSTLATIIASQALILGCFSILSQMIKIECFPRLKIVHKSAKHHGQIFIPAVNFCLMVAVICTCVGFKTSSNVTAAYGLGVSMDLFITSILITATMFIVYNVHWAIALAYFLPFGGLEMCLVIANLKKVPHGAWFTLMISFTMFTLVSLWRWGMSLKVKQERRDKVRLRDVFSTSGFIDQSFHLGKKKTLDSGSGSETIVIKRNSNTYENVVRHHDIVFMHTTDSLLLNSPNTVPALFKELVTQFSSVPSVFVFVAVKIASTPYVGIEEHVVVRPMKYFKGFYRCVIRFGFMDKVKIDNKLVASILEEVGIQDPEYFYSATGTPPIMPLNVFPREHIRGKKKFTSFELKTDFFTKALPGILTEKVRSFIVERYFVPLFSIQTVPSSLVAIECNERIMYVGSDIEI